MVNLQLFPLCVMEKKTDRLFTIIDDGEALDDAPEYDDVIMDFEDIVEGKCQIDTKTIEYVPEFVKKKYAFEIKDIPRGESDWVEATYPYTGMFRSSIFALSLF